LFAALQVGGADGFAGHAFGGMRQYEDGEVVLLADELEKFHELEGDERVFGAAAQAGDVIDDEHGGPDELQLVFDAGHDELVPGIAAGGQLGPVVEVGPEEVGREIEAAVWGGVTVGELAGGELEVDVEHFLGLHLVGEGADGAAAREAVGDLHGEDGFAYVGVGEEDADLAEEPEFAKKHFARGLAQAEVHPAVAGGYMEEVAGEGGVYWFIGHWFIG